MRLLPALAALVLVSGCNYYAPIDSDWLVGRWRIHAVESGRDSDLVVTTGNTFSTSTGEAGSYRIRSLDGAARSLDAYVGMANGSHYQLWRFSSDHQFAQVRVYTGDVILGERYVGTLDAFRRP